MRFPWIALALLCAMYFTVGFGAHAALAGELALRGRHPAAGLAVLGAGWLWIVTARFVAAVRAWQARSAGPSRPAA